MSDHGDDDRDYWLLVVELSDEAGPRRSPSKPIVEVIQTVESPEERYRRLREDPEDRVGRFGVARRPDLEPSAPFAGQKASSEARRSLKRRLWHEGYTVGDDQRLWHVYVIRLADEAGPRLNADLPVVYVGETALTPEERFRQHQEGARSKSGHRLASKLVRLHGIELMPELCDGLNPLFSRASSEEAERKLAEDLRARGYTVRGGT
ncbi:MAG: GIY-YIG nuclease family protein [Phycisphaerales bacterium]